ncbi:uncharacterized protein LOC130307916 isoform X2 [Hyla sarda]|uniref:uncharacterized protein LOC130307916 isoform X2 n=1 Tax=Hyla sarda TaxID=327740 RepID=UPI0024C35D31|nr:uncharacterized protein LOC130307916 isoform X2 [Hyla sarda]
MCTDVTNLLSSSVETLHSPLQKPPLLSSTPSMMLTTMPRKGNTFVRQLALCEALEDSVVLCGADSDSCVVNESVTSLPGVSHEERSVRASASSHGLWIDTEQCQTLGTNSLDKGRSRDGAGSGVKRLIVTTSNDRTLPSLCLLSPVMVSSLESQSVVFISDEKVKSHPQEHSHVFGASAELFSGDFTLGKEDTTAPQKMGHQLHCSSCSTNHVLNTGGGEVTGASHSTNHVLYTGGGEVTGANHSTNHVLYTGGGEVTGANHSTNHVLYTGGGEVRGANHSTNHVLYTGGGEVRGANHSTNHVLYTGGGEVRGANHSTNHVLYTGGGEVTGANHVLYTGGGEVTGANHVLYTGGGEVRGSSRSTNPVLYTGGGEVRGSSRSTNHVLYTGGGEVRGSSLSASGSINQKFFCRQFQPFVRVNSQIVTEYFQQKSQDLLNKISSQRETSDVPDPSGTSAPIMDPCLNRMQPVVSLDSAAVAKYFLKKDEVSKDLENMDPLPQSEASAVLTLSCFSAITKTPLITTSVLKNKMQNSGAPQTIGTGRKVCISGFSAKRWGTLRKKAATETKLQLSFQDQSREDLGVGDTHSSSLLFSSSLLTSSFMNSTAVMNLNLSTESLTGRDPQKEHHRWARLRAALSLHRRKKVEAGFPTECAEESRARGKMSLSAHNSSMLLLSPFGSSLCTQELTDAEKVFAECQQERPVPFHQCLTPGQLSRCQKVGEGVYGEVFRTLRGGQHVALKVIPIEGPQKVNGENQKSFAEILPEIIISKELSLLSEGEDNRASGFIQLHSAHCVQGSYPPDLLSAWDQFSKEKGTENERPDLFGPQQLFMILEFEFGGEDLERVSSQLPSVAASRSILHQVTAALAVAEEELRFEHRDLHWGNLLIEKSPSCTMSVSVGGEIFDIPNAGIQVKIIDYTLSRLDKDGLTVFCDLSTDEDLFLGEGDLQFDVYRKMRQENQNAWSSYKPHSNVLWLHYLCDKLLTEVKYIKKPTSAPQRRELRRLQDFRREVQQFGSATEVLKRSRLFK